MKKLNLLASLLAFSTLASAQDTGPEVKYAAYITPESARKHLTILASDEFEGRETGKAGAAKAAAYLADEFKKIGLQAPVNGSYKLPVPLLEHEVSISFTVNGQSPDRVTDYYLASQFTNRAISAEQILFIGYGTATELGDADLKGKVLLWINEDPPIQGMTSWTGFAPSPMRDMTLRAIKQKKPALILAVNRELTPILKKYGEALIDDPMVLRKSSPEKLDNEALVIHMTNALADRIVQPSKQSYANLLRSIGKMTEPVAVAAPISVKYTVNTHNVDAEDILGYLPGTDLKNELLIFSAHYDHVGLTGKDSDKVFNGADDDGSGTTAMLEIAKAFAEAKKDGKGTRRSILFLANVGEEKGLLGSEYYTTHPVFPLKSTVADLNMDMIGRVGPDYAGIRDSANYVYLVGPNIMSPDIKEISEAVNQAHDQLILDYKYDDQDEPEQTFFRSDHYNFAKEGIPIIFYSNGEHADYHKAGDEVGKINFPLLVKRAKLAFYTGWELANRDGRPKAKSFKKR
jgi:hypothetical protein